MALMIVDPCIHCHCNKSKTFLSMCQGTPFNPGKCTSAKDHWGHVGSQSVSGSISDNQSQKLRRYIQSGRRGRP